MPFAVAVPVNESSAAGNKKLSSEDDVEHIMDEASKQRRLARP